MSMLELLKENLLVILSIFLLFLCVCCVRPAFDLVVDQAHVCLFLYCFVCVLCQFFIRSCSRSSTRMFRRSITRMFRRDCSSSPPLAGSNMRWDDLAETYIDKTFLLAKILSKDTHDFIVAPGMRRVGKSTTVKMLAAMARGERELFDGMDVNKDDSPFTIGKDSFSVIQLDFLALGTKDDSPDEMRDKFIGRLVTSASEQHNLDISLSAQCRASHEIKKKRKN